MATLSQLDIDVRLQLTGVEFTNMLNTYLTSLKYGKKDKILFNKLVLLDIYINILSKYIVCKCDSDCNNNCLTETQAQELFDKIAQLTNLCFQPIGFRYIGNSSQDGISQMEIGCDFIIS